MNENLKVALPKINNAHRGKAVIEHVLALTNADTGMSLTFNLVPCSFGKYNKYMKKHLFLFLTEPERWYLLEH